MESLIMTAKEKQVELIKHLLKPMLKQNGYSIKGQTWWKDKGDFFTLIKLQNYSWNSKDGVDFCFNIGIALKATLPESKTPTVHSLNVYLREGFFLPEQERESFIRNQTGYYITAATNMEEFSNRFRSHLQDHILPYLNKLNTIKDCIIYFGDVVFWGDNLKRVIQESAIEVV